MVLISLLVLSTLLIDFCRHVRWIGYSTRTNSSAIQSLRILNARCACDVSKLFEDIDINVKMVASVKFALHTRIAILIEL